MKYCNSSYGNTLQEKIRVYIYIGGRPER
uniref:Uncharacterized protein n=1 Tax=Anguilla anguilla TaxID=7936 RepID=A0A0E9V5L0_ANGAN